MARRRVAPVVSPEVARADELAQVEGYYRRLLASTRPPSGLAYPPVHVGPSWEWSEAEGWALPQHSLGWGLAAWMGVYLRLNGEPLALTGEQLRWLLWWMAVDDEGRWLYTSGFLRRCKGWARPPGARRWGAVPA